MAKKCKKLKIAGYADGGAITPNMLGSGMLGRAGESLARRPQRIAAAVSGAQAAPAPVRVASAGALSDYREGATPPAHMLAAQRRGMKDGGQRGNADELERGDGGGVRGPGGPMDDAVGPVLLGNTEYVLPGDTVEAMGGEETLDAIRAATHTFADPAKRPAIARMANGGSVMEEISMGRSRADRAAIDDAVRKGQRPPGMAKPAGYTPTLDRVSQQMQARANAPKAGLVGGAARLAAPVAAVGASIDDAAQADSTARYAQRFGVSEPTGDGSVGDVAKFAALRAGGFASDLGNNLTLGAAGNFYRDKPDGLLQFSQGEQPGAASPASRGPGAALAAPGPALQPASSPSPVSAGSPRIAQGVGQPGTVNVARQTNGVMSFSGSGDVSGGYSGAAAKSLKGGSFNTMPASAFTGGQTPPELVAARAAAAARGDYQGAIDSINAEMGIAPKQKAIAMRLPNTFGEMMQFRAQMALNRFNQKGDAERANAENDRLRITQGAVQSPLDQERARGQKIENDRAQALSALVNQYLTAGDEKTRSNALSQLNALNGGGGKDGGDKYILADVDSGAKDAAGSPIYVKMPFHTRTGQVVNTLGGAAGAPAAPRAAPAEGTNGRGPDGRAYVIKNGQPVLVE